MLKTHVKHPSIIPKTPMKDPWNKLQSSSKHHWIYKHSKTNRFLNTFRTRLSRSWGFCDSFFCLILNKSWVIQCCIGKISCEMMLTQVGKSYQLLHLHQLQHISWLAGHQSHVLSSYLIKHYNIHTTERFLTVAWPLSNISLLFI